MTSKEALKELKKYISVRGNLPKFPQLMFEKIENDLDRLEKLETVITILKDRLIDYQGMEFQKRWYDGEEEYHYFLAFDENFEIELVDENQFKFLKEVFEDE